jgi:tRNA U34 5-methylaminomethyl-2-thiouridine-forming methyltransferase MnmC
MKIVSTKDGSHTVIHDVLGEHYHSIHGAMQESQHVFIKEGLERHKDKSTVKVFEMGFGTGLNALLSCEYAEKNHVKVEYYTIEAYPLDVEQARQLNYPKLVGSKEMFNNIHDAVWEECIKLSANFQLMKIKGLLETTDLSFIPKIDVVFYDAFAPNSQAHLWEPPVLEKMYTLLNSGGHLATYCAKGQFKRNLKAVGFKVEGVPGPPGKREMTLGFKP